MVGLPNTRDSDSLLSTPRCDIVLYRLVESTSDSTLEMASYHWMSCGTWWGDRERPSPVEYSTMSPVCVVPSSTGNVSGAVCSPWSTHWVCPLSFSCTVQQISSGQSWLDSSALTTLTPGLPEPRQSSRTQPSQTDWFFYHRVMEFVKGFYVGVLGATDYWLRFEWQHRGSPHVHGLAWLPDTPDVEQLGDGAVKTSSKRSSGMLIGLSLPSILLSSLMAATLLMHQLQRLAPTFATRHMGTSRTLTRTSLIWWSPARDTLAALPPTVSSPSMASSSATLATPSLCSYTQPSSQRMSQLSSQLGTMG